MNNLLTGFVGAVLGALASGLLGSYVILLSRPTGPGTGVARAFAVMFLGIFGAILGGAAGIVYGRIDLKGVGTVALVVVALCAAAGLVVFLRLDCEPRLDGRLLDVEIEFRAPEGYRLPEPDPGSSAYIHLRGGSAAEGRYALRAEDATLIDGQWGWRAVVPLETSEREKEIGVYLGTRADAALNEPSAIAAFFPLRMGKPSRTHFDWGEWVSAAWLTTQKQPAPDPGFRLRYRVRFREQDHLGQYFFSTAAAAR